MCIAMYIPVSSSVVVRVVGSVTGIVVVLVGEVAVKMELAQRFAPFACTHVSAIHFSGLQQGILQLTHAHFQAVGVCVEVVSVASTATVCKHFTRASTCIKVESPQPQSTCASVLSQ